MKRLNRTEYSEKMSALSYREFQAQSVNLRCAELIEIAEKVREPQRRKIMNLIELLVEQSHIAQSAEAQLRNNLQRKGYYDDEDAERGQA